MTTKWNQYVIGGIVAVVFITVIMVMIMTPRAGAGAGAGPRESLLSQQSINRFKTTGGAGICPSISQYYDLSLGYCVDRPKMVHCASFGGGRCLFDSDCDGGVCDRFGECHCGPGLV